MGATDDTMPERLLARIHNRAQMTQSKLFMVHVDATDPDFHLMLDNWVALEEYLRTRLHPKYAIIPRCKPLTQELLWVFSK